MLKLEVEYKSGSNRVTDPDQIAVKTVNDLIEYVKSVTIGGAREFRKQNVKEIGFPEKEFLTLVDGKLGANEASVKPFGKIEYVTKIQSISEVVLGVMEMVIFKSPVRTGYYHSMNVLMYNGHIVGKNLTEARAFFKDRVFRDTDKFRIINLSPYARKLERLGIKSGKRGKLRSQKNRKGIRVRRPNGVYWKTKNDAKRKFQGLKNNIKFSFIPVSPSIALSANRKTFTPNSYTFKTGKEEGRPYLYPSISITLNPSSFASNAGFTEGSGSL